MNHLQVWNNSTLKTTSIQTTISSNLCDKQRPRDWSFANRGCGCFGVAGIGGSSIAFVRSRSTFYSYFQ